MRFNIFILAFALLCGKLFSQSNTTSGYGEFKGDGVQFPKVLVKLLKNMVVLTKVAALKAFYRSGNWR